MKTLFKKIGWLTALLLIATFTLAPGIRHNSNARLNSLDMATDSTVPSQNKFLSFDFGGQNWGQPLGRQLYVNENATLTCTAHSGKYIVFPSTGQTATYTITLPSAAADCNFMFIWDTNTTVQINTLASDTLRCAGSSTTSGFSGTDVGDMIAIVGFDADTWQCTSVSDEADITYD